METENKNNKTQNLLTTSCTFVSLAWGLAKEWAPWMTVQMVLIQKMVLNSHLEEQSLRPVDILIKKDLASTVQGLNCTQREIGEFVFLCLLSDLLGLIMLARYLSPGDRYSEKGFTVLILEVFTPSLQWTWSVFYGHYMPVHLYVVRLCGLILFLPLSLYVGWAWLWRPPSLTLLSWPINLALSPTSGYWIPISRCPVRTCVQRRFKLLGNRL